MRCQRRMAKLMKLLYGFDSEVEEEAEGIEMSRRKVRAVSDGRVVEIKQEEVDQQMQVDDKSESKNRKVNG
jgi:hypothetical protein